MMNLKNTSPSSGQNNQGVNSTNMFSGFFQKLTENEKTADLDQSSLN